MSKKENKNERTLIKSNNSNYSLFNEFCLEAGTGFLKGRSWSVRGTREREESLLYFSPFARLRPGNIPFRPKKAG